MEIQPTPASIVSRPDNRFDRARARHGVRGLERGETTVLQINVGRLCNQACTHCHVEAGPRRTEIMEEPVARRLIELVAGAPALTTVDLTGGAPEMNPHFRLLVESLTALGKEVIVRCNLTILSEPGFGRLPGFYADQGVHLICSLPCYTPKNVDRQRGRGVFERSIDALRVLNAHGYGQGGGLVLDLAYNPLGPSLPGDQAGLEADYKRVLSGEFGVTFDNLYTLANLPVGRFARSLERSGELIPYLELLESAFNPGTVGNLMCLNTLSVGWDGRLFDCDFNLALGQSANHGAPNHIRDFDPGVQSARRIVTGEHCFGCTAGCGSSCGGALVSGPRPRTAPTVLGGASPAAMRPSVPR